MKTTLRPQKPVAHHYNMHKASTSFCYWYFVLKSPRLQCQAANRTEVCELARRPGHLYGVVQCFKCHPV